MFSTTQKIGVLGGGQLGKMLCIAAAPFDFKLYILEKNTDCPAAMVCAEVTAGDFSKYEDVIAFGQDKDVITIVIEHVNTDALKALLLMHKGVAWLPESAAAREVADRHFTALRGDDEWTLKLEINLYRARENARPVVGKLWRHLVKDDAA